MEEELSLSNVERIIGEYEVESLELEDDELIELADRLVGFDSIFFNSIKEVPFEKKCGEEERCRGYKCKDTNSCEFYRAISLADGIYRTLINNLDEHRKTLCEYLEEYLENHDR